MKDIFKREEVNKLLKNGQIGYCSSFSKHKETKILDYIKRYLNLEEAIELKDILPTKPMKIMYVYIKLNDTIIFDMLESIYDLHYKYTLEDIKLNH